MFKSLVAKKSITFVLIACSNTILTTKPVAPKFKKYIIITLIIDPIGIKNKAIFLFNFVCKVA